LYVHKTETFIWHLLFFSKKLSEPRPRFNKASKILLDSILKHQSFSDRGFFRPTLSPITSHFTQA